MQLFRPQTESTNSTTAPVRIGSRAQARAEWAAGWPVVITALAGGCSIAAQTYSLGVLMKPLGLYFGWSREQVSFALTFSALSTILIGPLVGSLADQFGTRNVARCGALLSALGMCLVALSGPSITSWYAAWLFYAVMQVANGPVVWASVVSRMFQANRGLALGVALSGAGAGAMIYPPLTVWLLGHFGWRFVYVGLAALNLAVLGPLVFVALPSRFNEVVPTSHTSAPRAASLDGLPLKAALRTTLFWRIAFLVLVIGIAISSMSVHLAPLLTDHGLSAARASSVLAAIGPAVIIGRLLGGALLDRIHARWIAMVFLALSACGTLLLVGFHGNYIHAAISAITVGLASGIEGDMLAVMVARYFGMRHFGVVYGAALSTFACGYALAPPAAGFLFDRVGSYDPGLIGLGSALLLAIAVAATLGPYPDLGKTGGDKTGLHESVTLEEQPGGA